MFSIENVVLFYFQYITQIIALKKKNNINWRQCFDDNLFNWMLNTIEFRTASLTRTDFKSTIECMSRDPSNVFSMSSYASSARLLFMRWKGSIAVAVEMKKRIVCSYLLLSIFSTFFFPVLFFIDLREQEKL